jgi:hypothetical protein
MKRNAFDIASIVASFAAFENKKKDVALMQRPNPSLPLKVRRLLSQESNLTAEIDDRHRRAAVAHIAHDLSTILVLEVVVPEVVQRNAARRRRCL